MNLRSTALAFAIGVVLTAATSEALVRAIHPTPRVQIVDPVASIKGGRAFRWKGDLPLWREDGTTGREACAGDPAGARVLMIGDSITFGIRLPIRDTLSYRLADQLQTPEGSGAWCVQNFAQPGYGGEQKRDAALAAIATTRPDVLVWEVWENDPTMYKRVGDLAVDVGRIAVDAEGWPRSPAPLPAAVHHLAFTWSSAWRFATLSLVPADDAREQDSWRTRIPEALDDVRRTQEAQGGKMVVWMAARLWVPFADQVDRRRRVQGYSSVDAWGARNGVPVVDMAAAWRGADPKSLGIDTCCHLNAEGIDLLARTLVPLIRSAKDGSRLDPARAP